MTTLQIISETVKAWQVHNEKHVNGTFQIRTVSSGM